MRENSFIGKIIFSKVLMFTAWKVFLLGLFWSVFSRIQTEYGEILGISPYSVQMQENKDQNNSEYRLFSRSGYFDIM